MSQVSYIVYGFCASVGKLIAEGKKTKQYIKKIVPLVRCQIVLFSECRLFLLRGRGGQSTSSDAYTSSYQGVGL